MSKFVDFDAMWAESAPEESSRPRVRVFGEDVILPATLPARIMLRTLRMTSEEADSPLSFEEIVANLNALFGEERVNRWIDNGAEMTQLMDIFTRCLGLYTPEVNDEGDEGNEKAPKTGAKGTPSKRSSKNGA